MNNSAADRCSPRGLFPRQLAPRLYDRVVEVLRTRHYSRRTEQAYVYWIRRFILFHNGTHPRELAENDLNRFLTHLAVGERGPDTGFYVGYGPGFPSAHTQAETPAELNRKLREGIELLLHHGERALDAEFVGIQTVQVGQPWASHQSSLVRWSRYSSDSGSCLQRSDGVESSRKTGEEWLERWITALAKRRRNRNT